MQVSIVTSRSNPVKTLTLATESSSGRTVNIATATIIKDTPNFPTRAIAIRKANTVVQTIIRFAEKGTSSTVTTSSEVLFIKTVTATTNFIAPGATKVVIASKKLVQGNTATSYIGCFTTAKPFPLAS